MLRRYAVLNEKVLIGGEKVIFKNEVKWEPDSTASYR